LFLIKRDPFGLRKDSEQHFYHRGTTSQIPPALLSPKLYAHPLKQATRENEKQIQHIEKTV
jgi:hypothetical protein